MALRVYLFGAPRFERQGEAVQIPRRKAVALVAYLAVTRQTHTREALAALLWPELEQSGALANLRRELPRLREALGDKTFAIDRLNLGIRPQADLWLDTAEFLAQVQQAKKHAHPVGQPCASCSENLEQAVSLYTEDFMAGFGLPDSPAFDEWQFFQSESLRQSLAGSLQQLISWQSELGDYPRAIQHARRWLSLDQLHEPAHRRLMQLYSLSGQQSAAIRQYQEAVSILQEELGVSPEEETQSLYQAIKSRQVGPGGSAAAPAPARPPIESPKRLPSGTISVLYTDIQGSTPLWERFPEAMEVAQNRHADLLYRSAEAHGGRVYKVIGDGLQIAFATPIQALLAAVEAQRQLQAQDWGEIPALRVRMGIHTGPAEVRNGDYVPGLTFFRVSHIMSAGHGGQILISLATAELVRDHLPEGFSLKDLGEYRFKGLSQAEHIFQVSAPELPGEFPALAAEVGYRHNLPVEVSPFIGREAEVAAVVELMKRRLVTILGPGGVGKSRLAVQAARRVLSEYPDGVWFVLLASLSSPEFLVSAVASALNVSFSSQIDLFKQLINHLGQKQLLLVLDNFENLLPEGVSLPLEILKQTANVSLLITSRERLNLQREWVYDLRGLSFPKEIEPGQPDDPAALEAYDAVQLFVQRARQSNVNYRLTAEDVPHVIRIAQLVEGMPLGLELAAPWVRFTSPREIAREIERNLDFLATDMRNIPERHRSLRAILEQTWQQLPEAEQEVLRSLALFRGSWSRDAAEQVAGAALPDLASLANRALIRRGQNGRYEMHTLVRLFALRQLQFAPGQYELAQKRHAGFYTQFLQERTPGLKGRRQKEALAEITADLDNVRAAWQWAVDHGEVSVFDQAAEGLWLYYEYRGALQEGENAFEQAIAALRKRGEPPPDHRGVLGYLMAGRGWLCARRGTVEDGRSSMEAGIRLIRQSSPLDRHKEAMAVHWLGYTIMLQGKFDEASRVMQESLELSTAVSDRWGMAGSLRLLGTVAQFAGRFRQAAEFLEQAREIGQEIGQGRIESKAVMSLGVIAIWFGDYQRAQTLLEEAVEISRDLNDLISLTDELRELGRLHIALGEYERAVEIMQETLAICDVIGRIDRGGVLSYLATALSYLGNEQEAERLYQESLAASSITGHQPEIAAARAGLGLLALGRGQYSAAEEHLQQALAIWEQIEHEPEAASVLRHLGRLSLARESAQRSQAWDHYRRALELASKHELAPVALDAVVGIARLLAQEGDGQQAARLLALAAEHPASAYQTRAEAAELADGLPEPGAALGDWREISAAVLENIERLKE